MSTHQIIDGSVLRQASRFSTEINRSSLGSWKPNRKRPMVEEEVRSSVIGNRDFDLPSCKAMRFNNDDFPKSSKTTTPITERLALPLSDITHQSRDQKCQLNRESGLEMRRWRREYRKNSPTSPTGKADAVALETEKALSVPQRPGDETVTYVNNLFSPVTKLQAIPLSLDELRRRTEYPEYFGRSEMVAYLRHSKTTGNEILAKYDLKPRSSRTRLNVLSRLCEQEAKTLANGIHKMNTEYFPMSYVADAVKEQMDRERERSLAENVVEESTRDEKGNEGSDSRETIASTIELLQNLKTFLKDPDEDLAKDLQVFESATHTFGCQNVLNHISFVENYLEELQKKL